MSFCFLVTVACNKTVKAIMQFVVSPHQGWGLIRENKRPMDLNLSICLWCLTNLPHGIMLSFMPNVADSC